MSAAEYRPQAAATAQELAELLGAAGLRPADTVLLQVEDGFWAQPGNRLNPREGFEAILEALARALGEAGTVLVPTHTYSFQRRHPYHVQETTSAAGVFSEMFRQREGIQRSLDPMYSVAGTGPKAAGLLSGLPPDCFGDDCLYHRLRQAGAKVCQIGPGPLYCALIHHAEQTLGAPYRFRKLFTGYIHGDGPPRKEGWVCHVPLEGESSQPDLTRLEAAALAQGAYRRAVSGPWRVTVADCAELYELCRQGMADAPWFLAAGPPAPALESEERRVPPRHFPLNLSPRASMMEIIRQLGPLPRDLISDGFDAALNALGALLPFQVHAYPTGTECWTWLVPEKWTCRQARLETLAGEVVFSYEDCPLHVVSYSLPFAGEVSREELFRHLHVHPELDDAIPFKFKYYERDWGLCCSKRTRDSLTDERYRVVIDSCFSFGEAKVGEVVLPGQSEKSFVLCAHLCHPGAANDGLSGVAVGVEVMRRLRAMPGRRYTYRLLVLPETLGSVAYLSHHEDLIPNMVGGLFLEMLGLEYPHALQLSWAGDTPLDLLLTQALKEKDPRSWTGPFRQVVWNDETQFNAPGVRVPMLSLSRTLPIHGDPSKFFPEYHTNLDNAGLVLPRRMEESVEAVLYMLDALEREVVPQNLFRGEVFCSRHGLHVDGYAQPELAARFFQVMFLLDGEHSVSQIARLTGLSLADAWDLVERFRSKGLVSYGELPSPCVRGGRP